MEPESQQHIGMTSVDCLRNSLFTSHCVGFGGKLRRHDLIVKLLGEGANTVMNGICITQAEQHYDNHSIIEHVAPHCDSEQTYRSMAAGESQSVFNGRILIHRNAQKSNANMSNKNLLLSAGAEIDTKPELEIYADDVKCAHGATIGQLDKEALFYLVSRGIDKEEAASMLSLGFINELVQRIPVEALKAIVLERIKLFLKDTFAQPLK
jgi:Fe-S cluster assembly protein SufD